MSENTVDTGSGEVTFVNGVAESQQTEGESSLAEGERSAAMAAVREAMQAEGKKAAKEAKSYLEQDPLRPRADTTRGPDGKFLKPEGVQAAPKTPDGDDPGSEVKRVLAERKQVAAQKAAQAAEIEQARNEARALYQQLAQERQELQREKARLEMLRKDPVRAIRENGWDPEEFILDIARDGTPEGQAARQQRELQAKLREMEEWKDSIAKQEEQARQAQAQQKEVQYRHQVETQFLQTALNEDKYPHVASFYKGHEAGLIAEADTIAFQYRQLTGKEASFEDVAEYLEERQAKWYNSRMQASRNAESQERSQVDPPVARNRGQSTSGNATGRTLNPNVGGERRTLGTNLRDLDGDERLAAARAAVGAAMRAATGE